MTRQEGISITASSVTVTMVLAAIIELPVQVVSFWIFGTRVELFVTHFWWMGGLAVGLSAAGAVSIASLAMERESVGLVDRWARAGLPAAVVVVGFAALPAFLGSTLATLSAAVGTGLVLAAVLWLQNRPAGPEMESRLSSRVLQIVAYALALAVFPAIYGLKVRSLLSATAVALASGALGLEIFRVEAVPRRVWLYGGTIGLLMGELAWALNYWGVSGLAGGTALFFGYYLVTSLARRQLRGSLRRSALLEFGLVALAGVVGLGAAFSWSW